MEILWEEEGFQFGFKRWQGWAVSKVLWEWIPNVGSKAREGAKAMCVSVTADGVSVTADRGGSAKIQGWTDCN